jgi:multisubunit Na+/H+ antiporter MnhG subunit
VTPFLQCGTQFGVAIATAGSLRSVSLVMFVLVPAFFILPNPFLVKRIARATTTAGVAGNE